MLLFFCNTVRYSMEHLGMRLNTHTSESAALVHSSFNHTEGVPQSPGGFCIKVLISGAASVRWLLCTCCCPTDWVTDEAWQLLMCRWSAEWHSCAAATVVCSEEVEEAAAEWNLCLTSAGILAMLESIHPQPAFPPSLPPPLFFCLLLNFYISTTLFIFPPITPRQKHSHASSNWLLQ